MTQVNDVNEWLKTKQTTLWGSGWIITADDSREKAAEWFAHQMDEFLKWFMHQTEPMGKGKDKKKPPLKKEDITNPYPKDLIKTKNQIKDHKQYGGSTT